MTTLPVCPSCGEPVGVYEPAVLFEAGAARTTSVAREPEAARRPGVLLVHASCAADAGHARAAGDY